MDFVEALLIGFGILAGVIVLRLLYVWNTRIDAPREIDAVSRSRDGQRVGVIVGW
jgi:hypothetical protein